MENQNQAGAATAGRLVDERTKALLVSALSGLGNAVFALVLAVMAAEASGLISF